MLKSSTKKLITIRMQGNIGIVITVC